ncbi:hypothetical protein AB3662_44605 [Sorangium cellulosum]|uniref:hypothetical protein n=1 Tax=Sorangium cellulosum TaxID=56 RepID=UPI003D9A8594
MLALAGCPDPDPIVAANVFTWQLCSDAGSTLTPCDLRANGQSTGTVEICLSDDVVSPTSSIPFELRLSSGNWVAGGDATNPVLFKGDLARAGCSRPAFRTTNTPGLLRIDATVLGFHDSKYATIAEVPVDFGLRLCSDPLSDGQKQLSPCDLRADGLSTAMVEICVPEDLPTDKRSASAELRLSSGSWVTGGDPATPSLLKVDVPRGECLYPAFKTTTTPGFIRIDATVLGFSKTKYATISEVPVDFSLRLCSDPLSDGQEQLSPCDFVADNQSTALVEICVPKDLPIDKASTSVELRLSAGSWVTGGDPATPSLLKAELPRGDCLWPAFRTTTSAAPVRIDATVLGRTISKYAGISPAPVDYVALTSSPVKLTPDKSTELQLAAEVRSKVNGKPTDGTLVTFSATVEPAGTEILLMPSKVYISNPTTSAPTKLFVGMGATSVTIIAKATPPPEVDGTEVAGAEDSLTLNASP